MSNSYQHFLSQRTESDRSSNEAIKQNQQAYQDYMRGIYHRDNQWRIDDRSRKV